MVEPVAGPSAWWGTELAEPEWALPVDAPVELVAERLDRGPGLAVVRGIELDGLTDRECLELGHRYVAGLGAVHPEDPERPGDGVMAGLAGTATPELGPHTDRGPGGRPPRLLALLCVRPAAVGGESLLVSGRAVHDALLGSRPEALAELHGPFRFGDGPGAVRRAYPVFRRAGGRLDVLYNRYWIGQGQREAGLPLTERQLAALDAFDAVLADPRLTLRVGLRRGELLVLDNRAVLHGRAAFADPPGPAPARCLARIWAD